MLHRMKLRVVYRGALAAAGPAATRRKWLLMGISGLAAYLLYKAVGAAAPVHDARVLLLLSGLVAVPVVIIAYARGAGRRVLTVCREKPGLLSVLSLRVGTLYAWQLSLMVLALLDVVVGYGFLAHPAGPGVMAILISANAVARDAHEIGTLHRITGLTASRWAVPDGHGLGVLWGSRAAGLGWWVLAAACAGGAVAVALAPLARGWRGDLLILVAAGAAVGVIGTQAYVAARQASVGWREAAIFFVWPAFTFFCTYALILFGLFRYVLRIGDVLGHAQVAVPLCSAAAGLLALNCWHLGVLKRQTQTAQTGMPEALLRCPFILDLLKKQKQA